MKSNWLESFQIRGTPRFLSEEAWTRISPASNEVLLLPVGATEQHGPHLPICTDTRIAEEVCAYASARTGAPVLPALSYGVSLGHTEKWAGTFSVFHETLITTVRELASWAQAEGWRKLLLVNAHCGNDAALRCAVDRIRFDSAGQFFAAVRNTWQLTEEIHSAFTQDAKDWHANEAETSLLLFLAPGLVRKEFLKVSADPDRTGECIFPHLVAQTSQNGVTGDPTQASSKAGRVLFKKMGDALVKIIQKAAADRPPIAWERTLQSPSLFPR